jgi:hypothetical protein
MPANQTVSEEIKELYEKFLAVRGKLYEYTSVPMTAAEEQLIEKEARTTQRIFIPLMIVIAIAAWTGGLWLLWEQDWIFGIGITLCAVSVTAFIFYLRSGYRELVIEKKKIIITGVITAKRKYSQQYGNAYMITLSQEKDVYVLKPDFEKATPGQIVQFETLSEEFNHGNTLRTLGHIADFV